MIIADSRRHKSSGCQNSRGRPAEKGLSLPALETDCNTRKVLKTRVITGVDNLPERLQFGVPENNNIHKRATALDDVEYVRRHQLHQP